MSRIGEVVVSAERCAKLAAADAENRQWHHCVVGAYRAEQAREVRAAMAPRDKRGQARDVTHSGGTGDYAGGRDG